MVFQILIHVCLLLVPLNVIKNYISNTEHQGKACNTSESNPMFLIEMESAICKNDVEIISDTPHDETHRNARD